MQLKEGTLLQGGKYKIVKTLGQGGFGITYLAIQSGLERKVAIKEFFMKEFCERDESTSHVTLGTEGSRDTVNRFREKFLKEARNIARLNHPNIVRIIDVFEESGTAYYVMEYAENGSLADKVKREGYLSEPVATRYILQVAEALDYIHQQKMNHLDVKPANIMLNEKDESILIDFGLSKQYDAVTGGQTSTTPVGISEGYAPMEQYMQGGVGAFSPETDIYALGATFYKLLTGITPPNASLVNNEGLPLDMLKSKGINQKAIDVIMKAMEGRKKDRLKTIRSFIDELKESATSTQHILDDNETTIIVEEAQEKEVRPKTTETRVVTEQSSECSKAPNVFFRLISKYSNAIMIIAGLIFAFDAILAAGLLDGVLAEGAYEFVFCLNYLLLNVAECALICVVGTKFLSSYKWYFTIWTIYALYRIVFCVFIFWEIVTETSSPILYEYGRYPICVLFIAYFIGFVLSKRNIGKVIFVLLGVFTGIFVWWNSNVGLLVNFGYPIIATLYYTIIFAIIALYFYSEKQGKSITCVQNNE